MYLIYLKQTVRFAVLSALIMNNKSCREGYALYGLVAIGVCYHT